jgi:probable rRNA maturation factor
MVEINNLTDFPIDEKFFKKVVQEVLENESKENSSLSVAFIKEEKIKKLNNKYLKKNKPTDVLSFPYNTDFLKETKNLKDSLGEIVICPFVVEKNAKQFNVSIKRELSKMLIHGILHLLGYEHEKGEKRAKEMKKRENYYLSLVFK